MHHCLLINCYILYRKNDDYKLDMFFAKYADPMTLHSVQPPYQYTNDPENNGSMGRTDLENVHYHSTSLYMRSNSDNAQPSPLPPKSMKKYYNTAPRGSLQYYHNPPGVPANMTAKQFFDAMCNNDYGEDEQVPVYDRMPRQDGPIYQVPRGYTDVDSGVDVDGKMYRYSTGSDIKQSIYNESPQYSSFSLQRKWSKNAQDY